MKCVCVVSGVCEVCALWGVCVVTAVCLCELCKLWSVCFLLCVSVRCVNFGECVRGKWCVSA